MFITTRVRSTREGNAFTLFVRPQGGRYPSQDQHRATPPSKQFQDQGYLLPPPNRTRAGVSLPLLTAPDRTRTGMSPSPQIRHATDRIRHGRCASCSYTGRFFCLQAGRGGRVDSVSAYCVGGLLIKS